MKINEKNLCVFATTPPYDLEGFLNKRGEVNKSWQKRYFVLKGNLLFYFEKRGDKEPLGLIIVEGCTIELAEEGEPYSFQIVFNGNRTYTLSAESQDSMELWMKCLTCAGYEYKKLMVAELQRQLDELEDLQKKRIQEPIHPTAPKPPPRRQNPFNRPAPPPPTTSINNYGGDMNFLDADLIGQSKSSSISITRGLSSCIISNSDLYSSNTGADTSQSTSSLTSNLLNDEQEFNFQYVHKMFKQIIIDDINDYRKRKESINKPLIEF